MDYFQKLKHHYKPAKGWVNDPNGLVYFKGYYHIFYQHVPNYETPCDENNNYNPMCWGHARTKDFITYEELPVALAPDKEYDCDGCWSGTAIVKDGTLYVFYASISKKQEVQTVSVAYSDDGINFTKYEGNPIIDRFPDDGCRDFRDPAVCKIDGVYYCVMASGKEAKARLLLYKSENLTDWSYAGIMLEQDGTGTKIDGKRVIRSIYECPSIMEKDGKLLLLASVANFTEDETWHHSFSANYGTFENGRFTCEYSAEMNKGPDQYAGQVFKDEKGRCILISWIPGWKYQGYIEGKDVGCMSLPSEINIENGKMTAYPVKEVRHLLKDSDDALKMTEDGFIVEREGRDPLVYKGKFDDLKILRDGYIMEIFLNGGSEIYTVLL